MTNYSPLRYPGGKGKLAPYIKDVLALNKLTGGHYAEPFAGGAAVALDLLFSGFASHIHINDIDPCVHAFWESAVHHSDALIERIANTNVTTETWLEQREVKRNAVLADTVALGFATFFLNRTNRSGILNGGMIGGLGQAGEWRLDCRFNKLELVERLKRVAFHRSRISVTKLDAKVFIGDHIAKLKLDCFVYIDPPYFAKGAYLYENHYTKADHVEIAETIGGLKQPWMVSYDNAEQIRRIYSAYDQEQFSIGYSARNHNEGAEVMIYSPELLRPAKVFSNMKRKRQLARDAVAATAN